MVLVGVRCYYVFKRTVRAVFVYVCLERGRAALARTGVYQNLGIAHLYKHAVARIFVAQLDKMYGEFGGRYLALAACYHIVLALHISADCAGAVLAERMHSEVCTLPAHSAVMPVICTIARPLL